MVSALFFYQLVLVALLWLCVCSIGLWPSDRAAMVRRHPNQPRHRASAPASRSPFLASPTSPTVPPVSRQPRHQPPSRPPAPCIISRRDGRARWNLAAFLPPSQLCVSGLGGTGQFPCQRASQWWPWRQCIARVRAIFWRPTARRCMASASRPSNWCGRWARWRKGLGIRAVARVFEVDPNTVLQWLVEVADHATAFSRYFLHDVRVTQVQLDELFALLSAVKAGEVSEAEAIRACRAHPSGCGRRSIRSPSCC